jgi:hypothetical protein
MNDKNNERTIRWIEVGLAIATLIVGAVKADQHDEEDD